MKLKKPNKHVVGAVAIATAAGTMLPACQPYFDNLIFQSENLPARGAHAIELNLTQAELNYLRFLQNLSNDIIQHPMIAEAFARNPQLFLEKYGFNEPIDLDDGMLNLVLALGDSEINSAVNAGDIGLVLTLMEGKGLLNDLANSNFNLSVSEEQARELMLAMGFDEKDIEYFACKPALFCIAFAVVYIMAAVGAAFFGALGVVGYAALVFEVAGASSNNGSNLLNSNLPLSIWTLKGKPNDTYIAVDMYLEGQVSKIIDFAKSHNIPFDENKMRDFLKFNFLMQNN